jgi:antitoxin HigA-1
MGSQDYPPVSPGEMLLEEFLKPMGVSQNALARAMRVPLDRINAIIHGKRTITADTAQRLALALGTTPEFWLNLQSKYNLEISKRVIGEQIKKEVIPFINQSSL